MESKKKMIKILKKKNSKKKALTGWIALANGQKIKNEI